MLAYMLHVVILECPVTRYMKPDNDGHHLAETELTFSDAFPGTIFQLSLVVLWFKYQTEVVNVAKKCYNITTHQELLSVHKQFVTVYIIAEGVPFSYIELTLIMKISRSEKGVTRSYEREP